MQFFMADPDEVAAMMDRQLMAAQVTRNEVDRFLEEAPIEDIVTVRTLIRTVAADASAASFFDGIIYSRLRREGRCTKCGGPEHDHELFAQQQSEQESEQPEEQPLPLAELSQDALEKLSEATDGEMLTATDRANMATYNLDDLRDEDTHELLGFICLNCGMRYPSIEDRMRRAPDECSGCFMKSAHG